MRNGPPRDCDPLPQAQKRLRKVVTLLCPRFHVVAFDRQRLPPVASQTQGIHLGIFEHKKHRDTGLMMFLTRPQPVDTYKEENEMLNQKQVGTGAVPVTKMLTIEEAAAVLNVHKNTIWKLIKEGELPAQRIGPRIVRIRMEDLNAVTTPYIAGEFGMWTR